MIVLYCDNSCRSEREYIYDVILSEFWGVEYEIKYETRANLMLYVDGRGFIMSDAFFQQANNHWLEDVSLPVQPLRHEYVPEEFEKAVTDRDLPVIYGDKESEGILNKELPMARCMLDIFGSAFFMLTRYEEAVKQERDCYDRFPAKASLAYQEGFLERPIINEYLEILWCLLSSHSLHLKRKKRTFSIIPTHDVDNPFWGINLTAYMKMRTLLADLLKGHSGSLFFNHLKDIYFSKIGSLNNSYNTFDEIMAMDEENGLKGIYFFMNKIGSSDFDGNYDINDLRIKGIAKKLSNRGHILGIHPSFCSYKDKEEIKLQYNNLKWFFKDNNISIRFGGRQHYLRWECPVTWQGYDDAGLEYDMTLSYADHIGFRCGICYEYPVFNVISRKRLSLLEYPLIAMDSTIFEKQYMALSEYEAVEQLKIIKEKCRKYDGNFTVLWHNTAFLFDKNWSVYKAIIKKD